MAAYDQELQKQSASHFSWMISLMEKIYDVRRPPRVDDLLYIQSLSYWQSMLPTPGFDLSDADKQQLDLVKQMLPIVIRESSQNERLGLAKAFREIASEWELPLGEKPMWQETYQAILPAVEATSRELRERFNDLGSLHELKALFL